MLRDRSFRQRGKDIKLRELTDLIALRSTETVPEGTADLPDEDAGRQQLPLSAARLSSQTLDDLAPEVSLPEVRSFEDSGWVFLPRDQANKISARLGRAKVFIKSGGRLALSTNRLVVKLHDDPQKPQANGILERFGCQVLEKLSFAPGLFTVEVTDPAQGDSLDVANTLASSNVCEFAEPELIEAIGGR